MNFVSDNVHKEESYIYSCGKQQNVKHGESMFMKRINQFHDLGIVVALLIDVLK